MSRKNSWGLCFDGKMTEQGSFSVLTMPLAFSTRESGFYRHEPANQMMDGIVESLRHG
ncbi:MAG TPA: hypothetical protein PKW33_07530 [Anaerolineaceae bacterium]|nr:hypothetical protein [Anaerolineaceae bacterium]HPN51423.1 hypothetical protein [Anaerolineaceae bacterium]